MAISRIGGKALKANLERDTNLAFNTNTLVVDYSNGRIGIGKTNPTTTLDITGSTIISSTLTVDDIEIKENKISSLSSNADITLSPSGTGTINGDASKATNFLDPTSDQDLANNAYVDAQGSDSTAMEFTLGTPTCVWPASPPPYRALILLCTLYFVL